MPVAPRPAKRATKRPDPGGAGEADLHALDGGGGGERGDPSRRQAPAERSSTAAGPVRSANRRATASGRTGSGTRRVARDHRARKAGVAQAPGAPPWLGRKTMRSGRDAEGGEGGGDRAEGAAREAGALVDDEEAAGVGAKAGGEAGREAEAALERVADGADGQRPRPPSRAATTAARVVPMLRMPMTSGGRSQATRAAAAATACGARA